MQHVSPRLPINPPHAQVQSLLQLPSLQFDQILFIQHRARACSLSADHRVSDGHTGARFLNALGDWLQRPEDL